MLAHMRTSVDIPDALFQRAKKLARTRGTTLRALLIEALRQTLDGELGESHPGYTLEDCSFGGDGLVDGLAWTDSEAIREKVYEGRGT
jgi:hypothetical protein